jgi:hypothetical protein
MNYTTFYREHLTWIGIAVAVLFLLFYVFSQHRPRTANRIIPLTHIEYLTNSPSCKSFDCSDVKGPLGTTYKKCLSGDPTCKSGQLCSVCTSESTNPSCYDDGHCAGDGEEPHGQSGHKGHDVGCCPGTKQFMNTWDGPQGRNYQKCCKPRNGGIPCTTDVDCADHGGKCSNGQCVTHVTPIPPPPPSGGCKTDSDCPNGQPCRGGQCIVPNPSGKSGIPVEQQPEKIQIVNGSKQSIWVAFLSTNTPDVSKHWPGAASDGKTGIAKIQPGQSLHYPIKSFVNGARIWPLLGCDVNNKNCRVGGSVGDGILAGTNPPGGKGAYAVPINSKFEFTLVDKNNLDWFNTSAVDGTTLPYVWEFMAPNEPDKTKQRGKVSCMFTKDNCPRSEIIEKVGSNINLEYKDNEGDYIGCFSPCGYLAKGGAFRDGIINAKTPYQGQDRSPIVAPYCCPGAVVSSKQCNAGPVNNTEWCKAIHKVCRKEGINKPGVYCQAFDDEWGLSGVNTHGAKFKVIFYDNGFKNYGVV